MSESGARGGLTSARTHGGNTAGLRRHSAARARAPQPETPSSKAAMKICIYGAGAIGGYLGVQLARVGR